MVARNLGKTIFTNTTKQQENQKQVNLTLQVDWKPERLTELKVSLTCLTLQSPYIQSAHHTHLPDSARVPRHKLHASSTKKKS